MNPRATSAHRLAFLCGLGLSLVGAAPELRAQTSATDGSPVRASAPADASQAELLRAYLQLKDQLQATQLTLERDRAETEASIRAQSASLGEKLESIRSGLEVDRERQRIEADRAAKERDRISSETRRMGQTLLWLAVGFVALVVVILIVYPIIQFRLVRQWVEAHPVTQLLPSGAGTTLLTDGADRPAGPAGSAAALAGQRLQAVLERLERRVEELEHTSSAPELVSAAVAAANENLDPEAEKQAAAAAAAAEEQDRLATLMGKARGYIAANKAKDAIICVEEVLRVRPNHAEALVRKGAALERLTRDEEAIRCYDRALSIDPNLTLAYLYKGGVCNRLGRYDDALECYEQAMKMEESRPN